MKQKIQVFVDGRIFEYFIVALILLNAVVLGLDTSPDFVAEYGSILNALNDVILGVFIIEALLKIYAVSPRIGGYFKNGWNLFDFSIIVLALIPFSEQFAMIARLARLLRVARLISIIPEMRLIIDTLIRSIPSMAHVVMLMSIVFYIYGIMGYHLFNQNDPTHWGNIGISMLTLFRIVTLEDWTDVMYKAMELYPYAWAYFVSFVVLGTFVVVNLFIAVVLNNLEQAKAEQLARLQTPLTKEELLQELHKTQQSLQRLQHQLKGTNDKII